MISETAMEELADIRAAGLNPTDADVIRLNALGVKLEAAHGKRPVDSTMYLPRVAVISDKVSFRQPTIGHDVWMSRVMRVVDDADGDTILALKAFCLSRPCDTLPDPDDPKTIKVAIEAYANELAEYTTDQIFAAVNYAVNGADHTRGEYAAPTGSREPDGSELEDWEYCVSAGVLYEGVNALYGCSVAELKRMTRRQVEDMIDRSFFYHKIYVERGDVTSAQRAFYETRDEIRARLENEKRAE